MKVHVERIERKQYSKVVLILGQYIVDLICYKYIYIYIYMYVYIYSLYIYK